MQIEVFYRCEHREEASLSPTARTVAQPHVSYPGVPNSPSISRIRLDLIKGNFARRKSDITNVRFLADEE